MNRALLPSSHSSLLSMSCECRVIIRHPSSVSPSWLAGVRQITYSSHTHTNTCKRTQTHSLELMRIQPHPGLSNRPNNRESLGALRVRQITGRPWTRRTGPWQRHTHTDTYKHTQLLFSSKSSLEKMQSPS